MLRIKRTGKETSLQWTGVRDRTWLLYPLVFSATGGMGRECTKFISKLAEMIAITQNKQYSEVITWMRRKMSIGLCKAVGVCLRGSRTVFAKKDILNINEDITVSLTATNIENWISFFILIFIIFFDCFTFLKYFKYFFYPKIYIACRKPWM